MLKTFIVTYSFLGSLYTWETVALNEREAWNRFSLLYNGLKIERIAYVA